MPTKHTDEEKSRLNGVAGKLIVSILNEDLEADEFGCEGTGARVIESGGGCHAIIFWTRDGAVFYKTNYAYRKESADYICERVQRFLVAFHEFVGKHVDRESLMDALLQE